MSTSGSYNWTVTRNDIIEQALRKIGALGDHTAVTSDTNKLNVGIAAINPVLRHLTTKGMPLWAMSEVSVPFTAFTTSSPVEWGPAATIAASYRPLKVVNAIRRDSTNSSYPIDTPMLIAEQTMFQSLSSKSITGTPLYVYHNPTAYSSFLNVWPLPDTNAITNMTMRLWVQREYQDFDASTDEPDFPREWIEPFIYALAYHLAPNYGLPPADRGALRADRDALIAAAEGWGVEEGSIRFQPRKR
jgi:phage tail protein X